ncbi:CD9 antigen-like [Saccoglossus kowalevskii]
MGTPKKKEMSETVWCCMYIIRVYSFLLMILGSGLVAVGLWLRLDPVTQQYVNSVEGLDQYYYGTYAMMGCGAFMILVGFLGCCGACCESQCLLCMYVVLLVCLFLMEVGGGVWAYFHKDKVKEVITEGLMTTVKDVYGKEGSGEVATKALDSLQSDLKCCGASAPTDWYNSYYSDEVSTLSLIYSVPDSCCKDVTVDSLSEGINSSFH